MEYPYGDESDGYGIDDPDELFMATLAAWLNSEHGEPIPGITDCPKGGKL